MRRTRGVRLQRDLAHEPQDLVPAAAPGLEPGEVRDQGGENGEAERRARADLAQAGQGARSQQHRNGGQGHAELLGQHDAEEDGVGVVEEELDGRGHPSILADVPAL